MKDKWLYIFGIIVFSVYAYINITDQEGCAKSLQSMREESNPEYYILQEIRKGKQ